MSQKFAGITAAMIFAGVLTACGTRLIGKDPTDESVLLERAAFALDKDKDEITISDIKEDEHGSNDTYFLVHIKDRKKPIKCYVNVMHGFDVYKGRQPLIYSDAICSGKDDEGKSNQKACNALLKAANKC